MALESSSVRGVKTWYGPQDLSQSEKKEKMQVGATKEATVTVTGSDYASAAFTLPKGAIIDNVFVEVVEAFALGGTNPTIILGDDATDFIAVVTEAQAEALGTYAEAAGGTYAAPLAANTDVTCSLGGTSPTITNAGKLHIHFTYRVDKR